MQYTAPFQLHPKPLICKDYTNGFGLVCALVISLFSKLKVMVLNCGLVVTLIILKA